MNNSIMDCFNKFSFEIKSLLQKQPFSRGGRIDNIDANVAIGIR